MVAGNAGSNVDTIDSLQILGVTLDSHALSLDNHVSNMVKSCNAIITPRPFSMFVSPPQSRCCKHRGLCSRLDYCNEDISCHAWKKTLTNCSVSEPCMNTERLCRRRQQNALQLRHSLHWSSVRFRTDFKVATVLLRVADDRKACFFVAESRHSHEPQRCLR